MPRRRLLTIAALYALLPGAVLAQSSSSAVVVATCGTPPATYAAGQTRPLTQDVNGNSCSSATLSGSVSATTSATAAATPAAVVAGTGKPIYISLFSELFTRLSFGGVPLALGQAAMAGSLPVAIASDQGVLGVNLSQVGGGAVPSLGTGILGVTVAPTSTAAAAIVPVVSTAAEGSHVLKASAGNLYGVYATVGASAGYLMVFNATSAPADGAVTPLVCVPVAANQVTSFSFPGGVPARFGTGITAVFSTTGCFTKTISATAFISGMVQ